MSASLKDFSGTLVLVGAGKMGGAMLEGWLALGPRSREDRGAWSRSPPTRSRRWRRAACGSIRASVDDASVIVIAIKPQDAATVVPTLKPLTRATTVAVSIMAGPTLGFLAGRAGRSAPSCARCRTRRPRSAAASRSRCRTRACRRISARSPTRCCARSARSSGSNDEALIDAVTAVSGSGPAYVFLLAESLARAGAAAGLPADLAARLARATVSGSGELLHRSPLDAATLRQNVTSPGGTTAAALGVLMARRWPRSADGKGGRGCDQTIA